MTRPYSVILTGEAHATLLRKALPQPSIVVTTEAAYLAATARPDAVAFVDFNFFHLLDPMSMTPIIGIMKDAQTDTLVQAIEAIDDLPWLCHVVSSSLLASTHAPAHFAMLLDRLHHPEQSAGDAEQGIGRIALLAASTHRHARLDRIRDFFANHGLSSRTLTTINDITEELVTNALYDAPVEAGFFKQAVPRTNDVVLPVARACEISYGIDPHGMVFLRLRDTFGAFKRVRLLNVLDRCKQRESVKLDESRGGAGLGLWRVFSTASTLAITVIPGVLTDIRIGLAVEKKKAVKQFLAMHLMFVPPSNSLVVDSHRDHNLLDNSIALPRATGV